MPNVLRYRASQSPSSTGAQPRRVTSSYLQPLLEAAAAHGLTPADLARGVGLAPDALSQSAMSEAGDGLAADVYVDLLETGAELAGDAFFGLHVGERVRMGTYSVYGLMLLSCENYGQAFQQTMRYEELAHDLGKSDIGVDGFMARYTWRSFYPPRHRHLVDSVFAGIRVFSNWLAGTTLPPALITLSHDGAGDNAEYARIFGALPAFGASDNSASFPAQMLEWPVPNADVALYPLLQRHAELLLRQRSQAATAGDIVRQVEAVVIRNLAQDRARLASVAQDLNLAPRTLQRKLGDAGTSFQQVLDDARHALARDYLRQPDLGLADISFLLGYKEQSAFTHAFREWAGISPGAWRQQDGNRAAI
jgi:AraC-like DNA-binding protein